MKIFKWFSLVGFLLVLTFVFAACLPNSGQGGVPLFNEQGEEIVTEDAVTDINSAPSEEFGYIVEGTSCVKQLHGGCVPSDYKKYQSTAFTLPFVYSSAWINTHADQNSVTFSPPELTSENDPTIFKIWRQAYYDSTYDIIQEKLVDAGTGLIGPYDVTWQIYEGSFNGVLVKAEWVTLVVDENQPLINYVYFVMTEIENFATDQATVKAAASSILME